MQSVTYYFTFWKNVILLQLHITYYFYALFSTKHFKKEEFLLSKMDKDILDLRLKVVDDNSIEKKII